MTIRILTGDCRDVLRTLADGSVQCCVTSPPYYGLRDYGVSGQIGLERSMHDFIAELVVVFREVRRVLRDDGTLWLNIGDSYATGAGGVGKCPGGGAQGAAWTGPTTQPNRLPQVGLKPKDLMLVPERLALALQDDGWYVRSRIIWHKLSAMPESVTDRPTKAHEHIWLLSKSERYFYDKEAASEPVTQDERRPTFRGGAYVNNATFENGEGGKSTVTGNVRVKVPSGWDTKPGSHGTIHREGRTQEPEYATVGIGHNERERKAVPNGALSFRRETKEAQVPGQAARQHRNEREDKQYGGEGAMRNWRDVWPIGPEPFKEAHFATFPTEIPRRAILAGSRPGDTILDPFAGAGTTGLVADRLQRHAILVELNPQYAEMARRRIHGDAPLFAEVDGG